MGNVASISVPFVQAVAGGSAVFGFPAVDGVLAVASIPADPGIPILTGGFTYWTVHTLRHITRLSDYGTVAIGLLFFADIGLSEYRILDWRIQETIGLSDIGSRSQSIGLSDIGSEKTIGCPPLIIIACVSCTTVTT
jgi:hypothetical protein